MNFPEIKFDHDADNMTTAIGMTETQFNLCRYTIIFELINIGMSTNNINSLDQLMISKSGVLEKTLEHFKDDNSLSILSLLLFETIYSDTRKKLENIEDIKVKDGDLGKSLIKLKAESIDEAMKQIKLMFESEYMLSILSILKDTNYNYDKFIDYTVYEKSRSEVLGIDKEDEESIDEEHIKDVDDLIRQAFMNKNE